MKFNKLIVLLIPFLIQCQSSPEISQWRGPDRDGIYPEKDLLTEWPENGPDLIWDFDELGIGYSSVAVTSDKVFTAGTIDSISYIYAFDHEGSLVWKNRLGPEWMTNFPGIRSTPLIYGGSGYILDGLGILYCFDIENGDIIWSKDVVNEFDGRNNQMGLCENLLIDGERLFCTPGGVDTNVIALDRTTGELIWTSKGSGEKSAYCSPQLIEVGGTKFIITMTFKTLVSINAENGQVAWTRTLEGDEYGVHANTPIYRDGYLFVQDGYEIGCFMLKLSDDGYAFEEVWKDQMVDETIGHAVVIGDDIFASGETKKRFCCLDWNTGKVKYFTKEITDGSVISADGLLYCCTYAGELSLVKPSDTAFDILSSIKLPGKGNQHIAHPVIKNGRLYIRHINSLRVYSVAKSQV